MPTLVRFLLFCVFMVIFVYAGAFAIVTFFEPPSTEVVHSVSSDRFAQ
jgi:hypothetical protein